MTFSASEWFCCLGVCRAHFLSWSGILGGVFLSDSQYHKSLLTQPLWRFTAPFGNGRRCWDIGSPVLPRGPAVVAASLPLDAAAKVGQVQRGCTGFSSALLQCFFVSALLSPLPGRLCSQKGKAGELQLGGKRTNYAHGTAENRIHSGQW